MGANRKAKFFALYLGQKVSYLGMVGELSFEPGDYNLRAKGHSFRDEAFLLLRTIGQLTDEEAINVAKLAYGNWDDINLKIAIVPNAENIHGDILSVEIQRFINHPRAAKWYLDCHIQIDRVDADINKYGFINDGKERRDEIIDSMSQWAVQDYLRSIGILLPFTYLNEQNIPTTLSVDDILGMGWVKKIEL